MERLLGHGLGGVRIHTGPSAATTAALLHADAFAAGRHVWLRRSSFIQDQRLVGHELAHVIQQGADPGARRGSSAALEVEAAAAGVSVAAGRSVAISAGASAPSVQRAVAERPVEELLKDPEVARRLRQVAASNGEVRGQIVEEVMAETVRSRLSTEAGRQSLLPQHALKQGVEFIPGHRIKIMDPDGVFRKFSDGLLIEKGAKGPAELYTVFEAKASADKARRLYRAEERRESASAKAEYAAELVKGGYGEGGLDKSESGGQIIKDRERLKYERIARLRITSDDGKSFTEREVRHTPRTAFVGAAPTGVSLDAAKEFYSPTDPTKKPASVFAIDFRALELPVTEKQLAEGEASVTKDAGLAGKKPAGSSGTPAKRQPSVGGAPKKTKQPKKSVTKVAKAGSAQLDLPLAGDGPAMGAGTELPMKKPQGWSETDPLPVVPSAPMPKAPPAKSAKPKASAPKATPPTAPAPKAPPAKPAKAAPADALPAKAPIPEPPSPKPAIPTVASSKAPPATPAPPAASATAPAIPAAPPAKAPRQTPAGPGAASAKPAPAAVPTKRSSGPLPSPKGIPLGPTGLLPGTRGAGPGRAGARGASAEVAAEAIAKGMRWLSELGIKQQIDREVEARKARIGVYQEKNEHDGVLVVARIGAPDPSVVRPAEAVPIRQLISVSVQEGGGTRQEAVERWLAEPKMMQGAGRGMVDDETVYHWVPPKRAVRPDAWIGGGWRAVGAGHSLGVEFGPRGEITVTAWDQESGDPLQVSEVRWTVEPEDMRQMLRGAPHIRSIGFTARFRHPRTGVVGESAFTVLDRDTIVERFRMSRDGVGEVRGERRWERAPR